MNMLTAVFADCKIIYSQSKAPEVSILGPRMLYVMG